MSSSQQTGQKGLLPSATSAFPNGQPQTRESGVRSRQSKSQQLQNGVRHSISPKRRGNQQARTPPPNLNPTQMVNRDHRLTKKYRRVSGSVSARNNDKIKQLSLDEMKYTL